MLDLHDIARSWQDLIDEMDVAEEEGEDQTELQNEYARYTNLCDELGIESTVEALKDYAVLLDLSDFLGWPTEKPRAELEAAALLANEGNQAGGGV